MALSYSNVAAKAAQDAIVDLIDGGSGDAQGDCKIYSGSVPTDADTALGAQVLLATVELANPAFNSAADAAPGAITTLLGVPLSDLTIDATGTAAFFRMFNRANVCVIQGSVGTSGTDMIVNSTAFQANAAFTIVSCTITHPEG